MLNLVLGLTAFAVHAHDITPNYYGTVGWGTLALINAGLAQSKNHSGLLWWVVSLPLGPVATFLIVVFLDKRPEAVDLGVRHVPQREASYLFKSAPPDELS